MSNRAILEEKIYELEYAKMKIMFLVDILNCCDSKKFELDKESFDGFIHILSIIEDELNESIKALKKEV